MPNLRELADNIRLQTNAAVTIAQIGKALGIPGRATSRTEITTEQANVNAAISALATVDPTFALFVRTSEAAAVAAEDAEVAPAVPLAVHVSDFVDEGDRFGRVSALEMSRELGISVDIVLGLAGVQGGGDAATMVDPIQVRANFASTTFVEEPASLASVAVHDAAFHKAQVTSHHLRTVGGDRPVIKELFGMIRTFWELVYGDTPFRPAPGDIHCNERDGKPYSYEYPNPLMRGEVIRIQPDLYTRLTVRPSEPFPVLDPATRRHMVSLLASLTFVSATCNACGKAVDQFLEDKLTKLLQGKYYLRDCKGWTTDALKALGWETKGLEELKFKRNHRECTVIIGRISVIVHQMVNDGKDFEDDDVIAEFVQAAVALAREVYGEVKPKDRGLNIKTVGARINDITTKLLKEAA